ncbi:alpha/beta hydrolase [Luedemannella flava]|uniref:Alpha/beta hydrolase n=2 Tax=Luedemannella flava TaxID=349316 RepID=A0ABN2MG33_9ACTN
MAGHANAWPATVTSTLSVMEPDQVDESSVLVDGPWTHRFINANGSRFHVAELGDGPLVLFLHGFPEFWWAWHQQLTAVADAGYRAVALDLRGYGASDKPPRGYDGYTLAGDVTGLIRALGERDAVLVGAGFGGLLAWTTAAFHHKSVRRLVVLSAPHPLRVRAALLTDVRGQFTAALPALRFQIPRYEHALTRHDAKAVSDYLRRWGGPAWLETDAFTEYDRACRTAMQIPQAAFCAMETYRWAFRSVLRLHGHRFRKQLRLPIVAPTLQLHGGADGATLPATAAGSGRYVTEPYEWRLLDGYGHFLHREAPDEVSKEIIRWAREP